MKSPCVACATEWDEDRMIHSARGLVCPECALARESDIALFRGIWMTILGGPVLGAGITMAGLLVALCSGAGGAAVYALGGILVLGHAVRAGMLLVSLRTDYSDLDVKAVHQGGLLIAALLSGTWGITLLCMALWMAVYAL